jgi:xanthine dehydrogenase accessory factor
MLIRADGSIEGTVGGGLVEAEIMRTGLTMMASPGTLVRSYDLRSGSAAETLDMLCGGRLEVLLESLAPTPETLRFYRQVAEALAKGRRGLTVTALPDAGIASGGTTKWWADRHGVCAGDQPLPKALSKTLLADAARRRSPMVYPSENPRFLFEPFFVPGTVYLFGAGHVSQAVAALTHTVGFRTVVRDDREAFANPARFPTAERVETITSFDKALASLNIDKDSYLVIVTRGHRHDGTVLAQALAGPAGYIGMIGSRKKREAIYADMRSRGFTPRDLSRVHSPIGLSIGAETPEEIAVSIVAELIAERAKHASGHSNENRLLKNVMSAGKTRQNPTKNRSLL